MSLQSAPRAYGGTPPGTGKPAPTVADGW